MKPGFWIKLMAGVAAIALLIGALVYLANFLIDAAVGIMGGGIIPADGSGDYVMETQEPMPTMPEYMREDSFYDNAGSVGGE